MTARRFTLSSNGAAVAADGGVAFFTANGRAIFNIRGTFGGGTVNIQGRVAKYYDGSLASDSDYSKVSNSTDYTSALIDSVEAAKNIEYRFFLAGATSPTITIDVEDGF